MSLAIDVDRVAEVLLRDGWHKVDTYGKGRESTFDLDAYEFLHESRERLPGGAEPLFPRTGATWAENGRQVYCPVTSILAVRTMPKNQVSGRKEKRHQ